MHLFSPHVLPSASTRKCQRLFGIGMLALCLLCVSCSGTGKLSDGTSPNVSGYPNTPFTIHDAKQLIGGPVSIGRIGDVLLENDLIRVIIQKPGKDAGLGSFGGTIVDADLQRDGVGHDHFGEMFPLVNIEWTVNYQNYEVIADGSDGGDKILRATGRIDVYDYLDIDFVADAAGALMGQALNVSNRFDDRRDPFNVYDDLKSFDQQVITDYILPPGKRYVIIKSVYKNPGSKEVRMPVGEFVNGSGALSLLVPGQGFSPSVLAQVGSHAPGLIYAGFDGVPVSYGIFYDQKEFIDPNAKGAPYKTTSITYSGVTGLLFGEEFLKLLPLGANAPPDIHFVIPPRSERTVTRYFIVGDGSASSVMDAALDAMRIPSQSVVGRVIDAQGRPMAGATVALLNTAGATVTAFRSGSDGRFSGQVSRGGDPVANTLGDGRYTALVDMPGYHLNGTALSGKCTPEEIETAATPIVISCTLGESGMVQLPESITDGKQPIAARLTIVGQDPSPNHSGSAGVFRDVDILDRPFGVADVKYIAANGTVDLSGKKQFPLEPGVYRFVFSRGIEYATEERVVEVQAGSTVQIAPVALKRVVATPGYISADFHVHGIRSPDSSITFRERVLSAAAEGLDVLQSSDHDYLTDYAPTVRRMLDEGLLSGGGMATSIGAEVTPNQYGHFQAFPMPVNVDDTAGGALDWTASPRDEVSIAPDYCMAPSEITRAIQDHPGEQVVMINHIADSPTGLPVSTGWVTSTAYMRDFGVAPLSAYGDPVERRLTPDAITSDFPLPFGKTPFVVTDATAAELTIGQHLHDLRSLFTSALPTWFNLLNLGFTLTATSDSDSHSLIKHPLGLPRNFIASSVDPADGQGSYDQIDLNAYARAINEGKVIVSAGPFIRVTATDSDGNAGTVGDTLRGNRITFDITVEAPNWAWFDTIEMYSNTTPVPVDDATFTPMKGAAAKPHDFYQPYRIPRYWYEPQHSFRRIDGTLEEWEERDGKIVARVRMTMTFSEDAWVVVLARGTRETSGYRSTFPVVPDVLVDPKIKPEAPDPADLSAFHTDPRVGAAAWALTNPIFVDVDGGGYTAKYVRDGTSPYRP